MSEPTYTGFRTGAGAAGWGEISARARAIRSAYLAARCRDVAAAIFGPRRS